MTFPNSKEHMAVKTKLAEMRKNEEMGKILIAQRRSSGTKRENLILNGKRLRECGEKTLPLLSNEVPDGRTDVSPVDIVTELTPAL